MLFDRGVHHRRTIRLPGYDYAGSGAYFVTVVTQGRAQLLGSVVDGMLRMSDAGRMIERWWHSVPERYESAEIDEFIVMPNHVHGVIFLREADRLMPLAQAIRWFKTITTNEYIRSVEEHNWPRFDRRLWQRNYFERIIRNEGELQAIRNYILDNPRKWAEDKENPDL